MDQLKPELNQTATAMELFIDCVPERVLQLHGWKDAVSVHEIHRSPEMKWAPNL